MPNRIAVYVKPAAERAIKRGHPWLFDDSIRKISRDGDAGDLAIVFDRKQHFLAVGLFDPHSAIRVKLLAYREPTDIDDVWLAEKLREAAAKRQHLLVSGTNGYRLVHGENDGLPGLVVDRYDTVLVLKLYTAAWGPYLDMLLPGLLAAQPAEAVVLRLSRALQDLDLAVSDGQMLMGDAPEGPVHFTENGLHFAADVIAGHKTGFFFDQRDNRALVAKLSAGRRVLDLFAYSGGFSVYAAHGGATSVLSVDVSPQALAAAEANFALNRDDPNVARAEHETLAGDVFGTLEQMARAGRQFDMVIVDPPAFAKQASEIDRALHSYRRLARLALGVLAPDGVLVMASCSSRVDADTFFAAIHDAVATSDRAITELSRTYHAADHPIGFREGAYLKCLFLEIGA